MYRVLLSVDKNEERAVNIAEAVAELSRNSADYDVVLLNVFEEFEVGDEAGSVKSEEYYDETDFPNSIDTVEGVLEEAGLSVSKRREHGQPAETILNVANELNVDLIAIGGRKRSPTGKAIFGSVSQSVLLGADIPVLITMMD